MLAPAETATLIQRESPSKRRSAIGLKLAQLGFWFFLIKGLLWLAAPAVLAWLGFAAASP